MPFFINIYHENSKLSKNFNVDVFHKFAFEFRFRSQYLDTQYHIGETKAEQLYQNPNVRACPY